MGEIVFGLILVLAYPFIAAWLVGRHHSRRIEELEDHLIALREKVRQQLIPAAPVAPWRPSDTPPPVTPSPATATVPPDAEPLNKPQKIITPIPAPVVAQARARPEPVAPATDPVRVEQTTPAPDPELAMEPPRWLTAAKNWLLTGNLVAKLGLVILFIGVAFLLKYVAATVTIPLEVRLAAVVLADFLLLAWGWRLRLTRRELSLPIQGSAIAILMLVIFSASQRFDLIPTSLAFALLMCLMAFTCILAVLQESPWLAVFGITGGFASPILVSTGEGSHIALFSYYAVLNAGIFLLAWKRSWHLLNLLGFVFTFIIGGIWGGLHYAPEHYASAQAFLIFFFLGYAAIPLAFATEHKSQSRDYVDIALVLGTPLLAFGFQVGLVKNMSFGLAFSALGLGGFYVGLGTILWRSGKARWRMLVETFCVLGAVFGTLTIPFACDARWTSAAWALEGAGFVWLGLRSGRRLAWVFGLLLQVGAWVSFVMALHGLGRDATQAAHWWVGFLLLSGSAFAVAVALRRPLGGDLDLSSLGNTLLLMAAVWLLAGCWMEAFLRVSGAALANWAVVSAMLTAAILVGIGIRMAWPAARHLALAAQLAGAAAVGVVSAPGWQWTYMLETRADMPLLGFVIVALAAFGTSHIIRRNAPADDGNALASALLLWSAVWWFGPVINVAAGRIVHIVPDILGTTHARWIALNTLCIVATTTACLHFSVRLAWPQLRWLANVCWCLLALITIDVLRTLYGAFALPDAAVWIAWAIAWAGSEHAMRRRETGGPALNRFTLQCLHLVRTGGPWLALWPMGAILIDGWLAVPIDDTLVMQGGWAVDAAWSNYVPTWAMILLLAVLLRRSLANRWPSAPLSDWYRGFAVPAGTALLASLCILWNLRHDGTMAPLPYLPLLNPLDLTTGFVFMLWASVRRQLAELAVLHDSLLHKLRVAGMLAAYLWFNLILLRSAAHYLGIDYRLSALAASHTVQAMLSLVWSASALILMRMSARLAMRRLWWIGACLLGVVVAKLFLIDLANGGSMARVVSFVGVGLLLLLIGYAAPYPKAPHGAPADAPA